jgi:hypothetical protein
MNIDGSIPADNPQFNGVRSHIHALGFRNPQGMVIAGDGRMFVSDHGPSTDDEVDLCRRLSGRSQLRVCQLVGSFADGVPRSSL